MTVISATFGALPGVQFMHAICRFKAQEVNNPMIQIVRDSELNEGVTAIARRSLQAEGRFCMAAKSALGCENVVLLLRNFAALLHAQLRCSPEASRYLQPTF